MTDEIRCDHPGPAGSTCVKPYGHTDEEGHSYAMTVEIPPHVGKMIEFYIQQLEHETAKTKRARRWYYIGAALYLVIAAVVILI